MSAPQNIIAVVFDFDDTLTDDSTTRLLEAHDIEAGTFWRQRVPELIRVGWDPPLAYLKLILDHVGKGKPLGLLSNADLRAFGATMSGSVMKSEIIQLAHIISAGN